MGRPKDDTSNRRRMETELKKRLDRIEGLVLLGVKKVLSVKEAALLLGRSEKTIRNRINEIPHYVGGTGIVFRREDLEAWQCQTYRK